MATLRAKDRTHKYQSHHTVTYPVAGALLGACLPFGLFVLRAFELHQAPWRKWALAELQAQSLTYSYLICSTFLVALTVGFALGRKEDRLETSATHDALTGLFNRRYLSDRTHHELSRAARYGTPLAVLLIDVDGLKGTNDRGGHEAGDRALRQVAEALRRTCRETDLAARYGGDELAVLAPSTTAEEAMTLAQRIQANLRRISLDEQATVPPTTVSIGVADVEVAGVYAQEALYNLADRALYAAKIGGRDRVVPAPRLGGALARRGALKAIDQTEGGLA